MSDLPVACTLDLAELKSRRDAPLPGLVAQAIAHEVLPDGMRWRFRPSTELLTALVTTIDAERRCCRFLRFEVAVEPDEGPLSLTVTGPAGTREFLAALMLMRYVARPTASQAQAVPAKEAALGVLPVARLVAVVTKGWLAGIFFGDRAGGGYRGPIPGG